MKKKINSLRTQEEQKPEIKEEAKEEGQEDLLKTKSVEFIKDLCSTQAKQRK